MLWLWRWGLPPPLVFLEQIQVGPESHGRGRLSEIK